MSNQKSWSKVLLKNKKKIWRSNNWMISLTRIKNPSKLILQLFILMLSVMAVELLLLLVQDTSVVFAKTLIIVKIVNRINLIHMLFWKSKIQIKFQKSCSLSLMRVCQMLKQILNKMKMKIIIYQIISRIHKISKLKVDTTNQIRIINTIDITIMDVKDSIDVKIHLFLSKDKDIDLIKLMNQVILIMKPRLHQILISNMLQLLETLIL